MLNNASHYFSPILLKVVFKVVNFCIFCRSEPRFFPNFLFKNKRKATLKGLNQHFSLFWLLFFVIIVLYLAKINLSGPILHLSTVNICKQASNLLQWLKVRNYLINCNQLLLYFFFFLNRNNNKNKNRIWNKH